jgi:hypothetical protein
VGTRGEQRAPRPWWWDFTPGERDDAEVLDYPLVREDGTLFTEQDVLRIVSDFHGHCGCCCCLQAEGRWPDGLPHLYDLLCDDDSDLTRFDWHLPDGRAVTFDMLLELAAMIRQAIDHPPPQGPRAG